MDEHEENCLSLSCSGTFQANTAMRALSVPGVAMICEAAFEHAARRVFPSSPDLASRLGLREQALARPADRTPFGQLYGEDCNAAAVWSELMAQAKVGLDDRTDCKTEPARF
jgi:hypothetical protein